MATHWVATPNQWEGRRGHQPEVVVLHRTEGAREGTIAWFRNPQSQASSHYLVCKDGDVIQFVAEQNAAWTNGAWRKPDTSNPILNKHYRNTVNGNLFSITIEIELLRGERPNQTQRTVLRELVTAICRRWGIPVNRTHVVGHYQFDSVTRAGCPGLTDDDWAFILSGGDTSPLYVPQTGYWIDERFYRLYRELGGWQRCGYPLEGSHQDPDGVIRQVFENVMFEHWPSGVTRLGAVGRRYLEAVRECAKN